MISFQFINNIFILSVKFYQKFISPQFPPSCRFYPTCSQYAIESFQKYNFLKAFFLSIYRIVRCNPWGGSGIDKP